MCVFDNHTIPRRLSSLADPHPRHQRGWTTHLVDVDPAIHALIQAVADGDTERHELAEFFESVRSTSDSAQTGLTMLSNFADTLRPLGKVSRDLRRQLTRIERAMRSVADARNVISAWRHAIDDLRAEGT